MEKKTITEYGVYVGGYCQPHKPDPLSLDELISLHVAHLKADTDYKIMFAIVDRDAFKNGKPAKECIKTFCDIESKKLREVIYKKIEKEM